MRKKCSYIIAAVLLCFLSSSLCIFAVPFVYGHRAASVICAVVFWVTMLAGYALIFLVNIRRRKVKHKPRRRIGLITFFSSRQAAVFDVSMILFIVLLILSVVFGSPAFFQYLFVFGTIFSLHLHSFLNGDNYRFLLHIINRKRYEDHEKL